MPNSHGSPPKATHFRGKDRSIYLEEISEIGEGSFGRIAKMMMTTKVQDKVISRRIVARKLPTNVGEMKLDEIERDLLQSLDHKNIVELIYYYEEDGYCNLILEYVDGGDLFEFIHDHHLRGTGIGIYTDLFCFQMFRGLGYLHSKFIAHRDLKPENCLVCRLTGILKIADFGLGATIDDETSPHTSYVGTRFFRPPELLLGAVYYSTKVDIWSAAIVLSQMLLARPLFCHHFESSTSEVLLSIFRYLGLPTTDDFVAMKVRKISLPQRQKFKSRSFADALKGLAGAHDVAAVSDLLRHTLVYNPRKRLDGWQACNHRYFDRLKRYHMEGKTLPSGNRMPEIFDFSAEELKSMPAALSKNLGSLQKTARMPHPAKVPYGTRGGQGGAGPHKKVAQAANGLWARRWNGK